MHPFRSTGAGSRGRPFQQPSRDNHERGGCVEAGNRGRGGRGDFRGSRGDFRGGRGLNVGNRGGQHADGFRGRERNGEDRREYTQRGMTYGRLKTWSEMLDAGELVLFMSSQRQQIETFLNEPTIKTDWMALLVKSVNHAITAQHQKESIKQLLDSLCRTHFFGHFATFIEEKQLLGLNWDAEEFFSSVLHILEEMLIKLPQYAVKCLSGASCLLNATPSLKSIQNNKALLDALTDFSRRAKETFMEEKEKEKQPRGGKFSGNDESEKPPENFIDLSVVPSGSDLREDARPFVRSAKIVGGYEDVDHYLDVQFRLMRQDFVLPLREGISEFKKNGCKKNYTCSDLRLYYDVHIVGTVFKDGIDHILQFDVSKLKNVKWEFSKRLIFGSLLCLSKDNFETVLFATVAHRDAKNLVKGTINVNFKTDLDVVFNSTSNDQYIMAETTAYFESYCHVLEGLKEMSKALPLQDYIIRCKKELKPPRYLLPSQGFIVVPKYDVSSLMQSKVSTEVAVLTTVNWPGADAMCLNTSQREAAILALTKELAIIQGPPGTGKTYVGLKVMQVLLENMHVISGNEEMSSPVLVVCYTNHALDQFLEGVLEFCPGGIVRVGGKNNSEKLEEFNIKNLKQKNRKEKLFSNLSVRRSVYECLKELEEVSEKIQNLHNIMDSLEIDVVPETVLEEFIKDIHFDSLISNKSHPGQRKKHMRNWLNASSNTLEDILPKMIQKHLTNLILTSNVVSYNLTLTADMDISQRASLYQNYLTMYKNILIHDMQFHMSQPNNLLSMSRIQDIRHWLIHADNRILPDEELEKVIPERLMRQIVSILKSSNKLKSVPKEAVVETWLLGLHKDLHSQLDDVQLLTNIMSGEMVEAENFDDDDATRQAQNDRMIDDDDDDERGNYGAKSKAAMDNIASVAQRAEMLGIKEDVLMDLDNEEKEGEWKTVSYSKPMTFIKFQKKLKAVKPMTEEKEGSLGNVWDLDLDQRFALYNLWIKRYKEALTKHMQELVVRYTSAYEKKKETNREEILFILRSAKVIGMTTTGAAKHRAVLQSVGCKIIVVEEAAEVLESHIVTSLNKNCKHLILIGDHQQLRPSPTVYLLAKEYGLEISLFERLLKNKVPHIVLKEQHRMRPEISKIMRHIYPDLQDHVSVKVYDNIRGVTKNIFFIQHEHKETHVDDSRSKANIHEAEFLVALCQYLLHQGYKETEITILATYAGQVFAIKKIMKDVQFSHRVRVTAVDNFQGEENDIILLSLVRSNTENSVGFLKVDNRVCVALSRAKKGLYVTGNFDLLASQSKLWKNIVETATQEEISGTGLPVACQNHPEFQQIMTCAEDFKQCPEGGCGHDCSYRLACGHVCGRKCHGYDLDHKDYQCRKNCAKKCVNGHPCQRKCYQECGDCMVRVLKQIPSCGHEDEVACSVSAASAQCSQKCDSMLECEHICTGKCGQCRKHKKHEKCHAQVEYSWPCGHSSKVPCYMNPSQYPCQKVCGAVLECGHKCVGKCSDCLEGSVHVTCGQKCDQPLPCGHICPSFCSVPCLPCTEECPAQCRHGACFRAKPPPLCSHPCPACKEPCKHGCIHKKCKKLCSDICDMEPCLEKCNRKLKCDHSCSGLCGELCVCAKCEVVSLLNENKSTKGIPAEDKDKKNQAPHDEESLTADTENQAQPVGKKLKKPKKRLVIKVPTCKHNFYVDELDDYILNFDPDGSSYIPCPVCRKLIFKCMHYENANKERHKKREAKKAELKLMTDVSKKQKANLHLSQKKLEDSVFLSGFHSIDVTEVKNQVEVQAVSFKLKCAFILSEISSLMEEGSLTFTQLLMSRKYAVLKIKNRVTDQQKSELTTELLRCFWLAFLTHLESLSSRHDIDVPQATSDVFRETREKLSKLKPDNDVLTRAQLISNILRRRIKEVSVEETVKAKCLLLEQTAARAVKVMQSRDEDMLFDLLNEVRSTASTQAGLKASSLRDYMFGGAAQAPSVNVPKQSSNLSRILDAYRIPSVTTRKQLSESTKPGFAYGTYQRNVDKDVTDAVQNLKLSRPTRSYHVLDKDVTDAVQNLKLSRPTRSYHVLDKDVTDAVQNLKLSRPTRSYHVLDKDVTDAVQNLKLSRPTRSYHVVDRDNSDSYSD